MKYFFAALLLFLLYNFGAKAQYASQKDAVYLATIKAVADYKINDEKDLQDVESLRNNQKFLQELNKMLEKLSNDKSKNPVNSRVYNILLKAGKDIYDELK